MFKGFQAPKHLPEPRTQLIISNACSEDQLTDVITDVYTNTTNDPAQYLHDLVTKASYPNIIVLLPPF
jgi:hypothetical protein